MSRPKKIKECVRLSVVMSKAQADWIAHMAIKMSSQHGRAISVSEAIRMAVEGVYPVPKNAQLDMFV